MPPPPLPGALAVAFDDAAARRLAEHLDHLARSLRQAEADHHRGAAVARRDWHGYTRRWFDGAAHETARALRTAADEAARAATAVRSAVEEAGLEQHRRNLTAAGAQRRAALAATRPDA